MKKFILSSVLISNLAFALGSEYQYEITPVVGKVFTKDKVELENHKAVGAYIGFKVNETTPFDQFELGIIGSRGVDNINGLGDKSIYRFMLDGVKNYNINDTVGLFAVAGLGYEKHSKTIADDKSKAQFNYGFGAKYYFTDAIALRTDVRHLINFDNHKNILWTLGLSFAFGQTQQEMPKKEQSLEQKVEQIVEPKIEKKEIIQEIKAVEQIPENIVIYFDVNSAEIKNNYDVKIKDFSEYLNMNNDKKLLVQGYTDTTGSVSYNQKLSQKRANNVSQILEKNGISSDKIEQSFYGEEFENAKNETTGTRQINRKVTVSIK